MEHRLRRPVGRRVWSDLEQHRLRIVEKEVREILQLVGVVALLELAYDRAQSLRFRQNLHLGVERPCALKRARRRFAAILAELALAAALRAVALHLAREGFSALFAAAFALSEALRAGALKRT